MRIALIISMCLVLAGCAKQISHTLPTSNDISEMQGQLYNRPDSGPNIGTFSIANQDYDKVLALFDDKTLDRSPSEWQVLGTITIKPFSSDELCIYLFWTNETKGAFRIGKTYYRGSTDKEIIKVLSDCHTTVEKNKKVEQKHSGDGVPPPQI